MTKLNALKLFGMAKAYEELQMTVKSGELSIDEALGTLVDREQISRDNRAVKARLNRAKLREQAVVEDINWRHPCGLEKQILKPLISCDWVKRRHNVVFVGPTVIGKTWLSCALANRACSLGLTAKFFRVPRLFGELNMARGNGTYEKLMSTIAKTDLVIFDDWGQALAEQERRDIMEIIEDRCDRGSVIITTQTPVDRWHEVIGDMTIADAIVDRIINRAHVFKLKGDTMRVEGRPPLTKDQQEKSFRYRGLASLRSEHAAVAMPRNGWPRWTGIIGRLPSGIGSRLRRNT